MTRRTFATAASYIMLIVVMTAVGGILAIMPANAGESPWQKDFGISSCNLLDTGRNEYFVLEPGYQLTLESDGERLRVTVLDETKIVDGVVTRVVEEREWQEESLYEVSRNYFAICEETNDIFYFGEDVDYYRDGKVVKHEGAWLAGVNNNKPGLMMPGSPSVGMKYYQEIAPGVAMDRAEIISLTEICETPAGRFSSCMKVKEGTALNVLESEYKYFAPMIGLIQDEDLVLTKYGLLGQEH